MMVLRNIDVKVENLSPLESMYVEDMLAENDIYIPPDTSNFNVFLPVELQENFWRSRGIYE